MSSSSAVHACTYVIEVSDVSDVTINEAVSTLTSLTVVQSLRSTSKLNTLQPVMTRRVLKLFIHMLLFKQANAYKSTTPELTLQPHTAIIKVCQKSDKPWCHITRWHTLRPSNLSDSQTLKIFNQSNMPRY